MRRFNLKTSLGLTVGLMGVFVISLTLSGSHAQDTIDLTRNPVPLAEGSILQGETVFSNYCAGCHGRRADGRGPQAFNLVPKPQNLRNPQFVKYLTDYRLFTSISGGVRGTAMPAFEMMLSKDKRWHVINYIRSLTVEDDNHPDNSVGFQPVSTDMENPVDVSPESIARGNTFFAKRCVSCHGEKSDGNGLLAVNMRPAPRNLVVIKSWGEKPFIDYMSDSRIYDSITNGVPGTSMQPWIRVFNDDERWDIVNYLRWEAEKQHTEIDQALQ